MADMLKLKSVIDTIHLLIEIDDGMMYNLDNQQGSSIELKKSTI